jgi:DNA polymerase (family X)
MERSSNKGIAEVLDRVADLLEAQNANPFRIRAYRRAASVIENSTHSISELADSHNGKKLEDLPDIGKSTAGAVREFVHTGRLNLLDRLEGQVSPEDLFTTIPGISDALAKRIHLELHIETLEELELAAHDGRLKQVPGFGERRVKSIQNSLDVLLSRSARRRARRLKQLAHEHDIGHDHGKLLHPSASVVLEIDKEYRTKAKEGALEKITPRRFNPENRRWLPVLHADKEGWNFTAFFSNSARAHELRKTDDWVIIFYERDGHENQCTVVTETHGSRRGKRVIRGRENECLRYYS